jgi:hypothetical protein
MFEDISRLKGLLGGIQGVRGDPLFMPMGMTLILTSTFK